MSNYKPTIGLEIHAELKTESKMFCGCPNKSDETEPNKNTCPVCLGHPGVLPTINREAVRSVIKLGLAVGGTIPPKAKFDRKNYFYPDLPKGYQISQYDEPLVLGGLLKGVRIRRVHLEEDTGTLVHDDKENISLVSYNRSSAPLMELVTEPDITSGEQAAEFAMELQRILRYLNVSNADMEKGEMRVEANISVSKDKNLGTKVEVKNLNSFRSVRDAITHELKRQVEAIESGEKIRQETRGWNEVSRLTKSQRFKEEAHDYRYLPEPDLPPLIHDQKELEELKREIPELPETKRKRFMEEFKLNEEQANVITEDRYIAEYFEEVISEMEENADPKLVCNYVTSDLKGLLNEKKIDIRETKATPERIADLLTMITTNEIGSRVAKDVLVKVFETGGDPHEIVKSEGLSQVSDEASLRKTIEKIINENPKAVEDYKKGKGNALQFLIGKTMAELKGRANPDIAKKLFEEFLSK